MQHLEVSTPYLVYGEQLARKSSRVRVRFSWKKVVVAALAAGFAGGLLAGGCFALLRAIPARDTQAKTYVASKRADPDEVARLEVRNRRLEALVWALRQRGKSARHADPKSGE